jgi:hypothetical protein
MSLGENKDLIRRYVQALDEDRTTGAVSTITSRKISLRTIHSIRVSASTVTE